MKEHLLPLTDVLGYLPENSVDEYGIPLSELECYKKTDMKYLPSDAIICIRLQRKGTISDDSDVDYNNSVKFLKDIIGSILRLYKKLILLTREFTDKDES